MFRFDQNLYTILEWGYIITNFYAFFIAQLPNLPYFYKRNHCLYRKMGNFIQFFAIDKSACTNFICLWLNVSENDEFRFQKSFKLIRKQLHDTQLLIKIGFTVLTSTDLIIMYYHCIFFWNFYVLRKAKQIC